jgi:pyrroloquinoline-quinone synthase
MQDLNTALAGRQLLQHPLYRKWTAGEVSKDTLRSYAAQYFAWVAQFPTFVSGVHSGCTDSATRRELLENLIEEEHGGENHPELWLRFCEALGVSRDDAESVTPNDETRHLVETFRRLTRGGTTPEGLAALYAYESQVPGVARAKIDGLKRFYGIDDPRSLSFFTVHQKLDEYHSATTAKLLEQHVEDPAVAEKAVAAGVAAAEALWGFLDGVERAAA